MTDRDNREWERLLTAPSMKPDTAKAAVGGAAGATESEVVPPAGEEATACEHEAA